MQRHLASACLALAACGGTATNESTTPAADPATTGAIVGKVRDQATGEALSFATVMAVEPTSEDPPKNTDTTDAGGVFAIDGLAPGMYRVTVFYSNVSARWQDVDVAAGARVELAIDLNLEAVESTAAPNAPVDHSATRVANPARSRRGAISGQVIDQATGEKLEGAVVAAMTPALRDAQMAVSGVDGEFHLAGLPPGTYKLSCFYRLIDYGDIEVQRTNIEVAAGETTRVPIRLDTSATAAPE